MEWVFGIKFICKYGVIFVKNIEFFVVVELNNELWKILVVFVKLLLDFMVGLRCWFKNWYLFFICFIIRLVRYEFCFDIKVWFIILFKVKVILILRLDIFKFFNLENILDFLFLFFIMSLKLFFNCWLSLLKFFDV